MSHLTFFSCLTMLWGHPSFMDDFVQLSQNTTALIQPMDQGVIATFKKYYLCHFFHQAVKGIDESGTTLWQFWKDFNIYKAIKNIEFAWREVTAVTMNGVWKNLFPQFIYDVRGFEKVGEEFKTVFSNLVTLSEKLELELQKDDSIELLALLCNMRSLLMKTWCNWRPGEKTKSQQGEINERTKEIHDTGNDKGIFFIWGGTVTFWGIGPKRRIRLHQPFRMPSSVTV